MKRASTYPGILKTILWISASFALAYFTVILFIYSPIPFFHRYLYFLADFGYSPILENRIGAYRFMYSVVRVLCVLTCIFAAYRSYRYYTKKNAFLLFKAEDWLIGQLSASIAYSKAFFKNLPRPVRTTLAALLCVQFIASVYLVFTFPVFYDEAWSYMHFSGRGLPATMAHYPAPNNHVLFNVIGSFWNIFPIDPVLVLRLPSVFWGLLSTWYFFKLGERLFSPLTALLLAMLFACSFPSICYNSMGRGYGMLVFFTVLSVYSLAQICTTQQRKKYLALFCVASVCGLYTIPSFLYSWLPAAFVLFLFYLVSCRKEMFSFIRSQVDVVAVTAFLYLPIMFVNGAQALVANNGIIKRDLAYIKAHTQEHLVNTWHWLTGTDKLPLSVLVVFAATLLIRGVLSRKTGHRLVTLLCVFMIVSPLPFIYLQKTIPFDRTWAYLVIPIITGLGFFIEDISLFFSRYVKTKLSLYTIVPFAVACGLYAGYLTGVRKQMHGGDYDAEKYISLVENKLDKIKVIAFADEGLNFYLAEDIQFATIRQTGRFDAGLAFLKDGDATGQDVIVLKKNGQKRNFDLRGYTHLELDEPVWDVYIKEEPGNR